MYLMCCSLTFSMCLITSFDKSMQLFFTCIKKNLELAVFSFVINSLTFYHL